MTKLETLPQHFLDNVKKFGSDRVAMRQKEFGIWREYTWQESYEQVRDFALGLIALGLKRGEHIASVGDNDRQYVWAYLAMLSVGGVQVGMFTDTNPKEMNYLINHSDAKFVLAKDQEQCDKVLEIKDDLPNVRRVIYWEDRGLWSYDDPWLISFEEVQDLGRELLAKEPERFEQEAMIGSAEDLAVLCYTSGTTGLPKGVMLNHEGIVFSSVAFDQIDRRYPSDNHVSILPMGWIGEHILGVAPHAVMGIIMNFPEEPETVRNDIREIAPEGILYNSRLWDSQVSLVQVKMKEASFMNRKLYDLFLPIGYRFADKRMRNEAIGPGLALMNWLGDQLLFGPLRDNLGLSNIRAAYTAGSALSPDAMRFFHALGINLKQIYGSTEVTGGATGHYDNDIKFASVGKPAPGVRVMISPEGEILIASPAVFIGYYKNEEATAKSVYVDEEGTRWFRTGDAGYIDDDGHIIYLDRVKDMITLASGEKFSPQFIEGRLKFSPYVQDVMVVGGGRAFVTALVTIAFENVGNWAESKRIGYTTFTDLSQKDQVYALIREAVEEVNESLPPNGRIVRFVLMHKEFDADESEVTRSRKLRRGFLADRYDDLIEGMYSGADSVTVNTPVVYQDGSEGFLETTVKLMTVEKDIMEAVS
ncbi:MAG: AMP-binding protein [Ardenticatenaceae bacterium]|nr:AMP-binding protein [Ardenticatenaceae bacterium]